MGLFSSSLSSVRKRFIDIFSSRSNTTGSLGTASDGSSWEAVSKVIEVQDGKAVANYVPQPADGGSEYPIAVVNMPTQNNIITLEDTDVGSGVAFWVQTSSDWWMVSADSSFATIPGATNYTSAQSYTRESGYQNSYAIFTSPTAFSRAYTFINPTYTLAYVFGTTYTRPGGPSLVYSRGGRPTRYSIGFVYPYTSYQGDYARYTRSTIYSANYTGSFTTAFQVVGFTSVLVYSSSVGYTSNTEPDSFSYSAILRISRSVSDIVSEVSSSILSTTQTIKSIIVQVINNQITAKGFLEPIPVTQLGGDLTHTATGAILSTRYGISLSKSENDNDIIGSSIKIERE
jgi:hypothetical protein